MSQFEFRRAAEGATLKELARKLGCDEDEATFEEALHKLAQPKLLPEHEPKKRKPKDAPS